MNVDFAFLCDHVDASGDRIDARGIGFDEIYARSLPWTHPEFWYVTQLSASVEEVGDSDLKMSVIDAGGDVVAELRGTFPIEQPAPGEQTKVRIAIACNGVAFPRYGNYTLHFSVDGHELNRLSLTVRASAHG